MSCRRAAPGPARSPATILASDVVPALAPLLTLCLAISGCGFDSPSYRPSTRNVNAIPIAPSERERPGNITYRLSSMDQEGGTVDLDLDLTNGSSQNFSFATLWITLLAADGRKRMHQHPIGPFGGHRVERITTRVRNVPFEVENLTLAIQIR